MGRHADSARKVRERQGYLCNGEGDDVLVFFSSDVSNGKVDAAAGQYGDVVEAE